jgi:transaldolase
VKNEAYSDTLYVADLITSGVVNTMPRKTMEAFADHVEVHGDTVRGSYDEAHEVMAQLAKVGIDYDDVIAALEQEGVDKFVKSWDELVETVKGQMDQSRDGSDS